MDRLPISKSLTLASKQIETLFGLNDVANARMKRFASGHDCIVTYTDHCVVFHKMPPREAASKPPQAEFEAEP